MKYSVRQNVEFCLQQIFVTKDVYEISFVIDHSRSSTANSSGISSGTIYTAQEAYF
jgi:hypothetical protein